MPSRSTLPHESFADAAKVEIKRFALGIGERVNDGNGVVPWWIRAEIGVEPVIQIDRLRDGRFRAGGKHLVTGGESDKSGRTARIANSEIGGWLVRIGVAEAWSERERGCHGSNGKCPGLFIGDDCQGLGGSTRHLSDAGGRIVIGCGKGDGNRVGAGRQRECSKRTPDHKEQADDDTGQLGRAFHGLAALNVLRTRFVRSVTVKVMLSTRVRSTFTAIFAGVTFCSALSVAWLMLNT